MAFASPALWEIKIDNLKNAISYQKRDPCYIG